MDPKDIKLSAKEELKVIGRFVYDLAPWRLFILPIVGAIIGAHKDCGCGLVAGYSPMASFIGLVAGVMANLLIGLAFLLLGCFFEYAKPKYVAHRKKVQKEVLEKSDEIILK